MFTFARWCNCHLKKSYQFAGTGTFSVTCCRPGACQHLQELHLTPGTHEGNPVLSPFFVHSEMQKLYNLFISDLAKNNGKEMDLNR